MDPQNYTIHKLTRLRSSARRRSIVSQRMRFETLKGAKKKGGQKAALLRTEN